MHAWLPAGTTWRYLNNIPACACAHLVQLPARETEGSSTVMADELPSIKVSHLASSSSFYSAILQPLGLTYMDADGPSPAVTFGAKGEAVLQLRQSPAPRLLSVLVGAPSMSAFARFHDCGLRANPPMLLQGRPGGLRQDGLRPLALSGDCFSSRPPTRRRRPRSRVLTAAVRVDVELGRRQDVDPHQRPARRHSRHCPDLQHGVEREGRQASRCRQPSGAPARRRARQSQHCPIIFRTTRRLLRPRPPWLRAPAVPALGDASLGEPPECYPQPGRRRLRRTKPPLVQGGQQRTKPRRGAVPLGTLPPSTPARCRLWRAGEPWSAATAAQRQPPHRRRSRAIGVRLGALSSDVDAQQPRSENRLPYRASSVSAAQGPAATGPPWPAAPGLKAACRPGTSPFP